MVMKRARKLWIAISVAGLAVVLGAAVVLQTSSRREPDFVARFGGRVVSDQADSYIGNVRGERTRQYRFNAKYKDEILKAMQEELLPRGWSAEQSTLHYANEPSGSEGQSHGWFFTRGTEQFLLEPGIVPKEPEVWVLYSYQPNWLERQVIAVNEWFGRQPFREPEHDSQG